ncbi:DegT/DnrJ/EryC1/StrS family aminotransferase [Thermodesulfobacteriota bacterium]
MFSEFSDCRYAISTSNGTAALHLALLSIGVGPGDEVIVPTLTFIATANAVTYTGAKPIFVDSDINTWNIDPDKIEEAITPRTKAIIPVHLYGHPADMERILKIASMHGLSVIEDAAEAHGATYKGRKVGSIGDLGVFSFYGNKIVTTGEGGMVVTNDAELAEKIKILRDHGMSKNRRYWHPVLGFNYRLTNIQAAIGVAQMENIENILTAKRRIAGTYAKLLRDISGITLPPSTAWAENVFWLYTILIDERVCNVDKNSIIENLSKNGIETRPLFPPIHTQPIYNAGQSLPVSEMLFKKGFCLPSSANLHDEEIVKTVNSIKESIS